jgi:hypothetical protein
VLNSDELNRRLRSQGLNPRRFRNPIQIAVCLLKSEGALVDIVKNGYAETYAKSVVNIWQPQDKTREYVLPLLPKIFQIIHNDIISLKINEHKRPDISYDTLRSHFKNLDKKIEDSKTKMEKEARLSSNPYLTISVDDSFKKGRRFQKEAKIASSVETKWGSWIEHILPKFNSSIKEVNAGGFDCVLSTTAYDIKSGPSVMNKGLVQGARKKREAIRSLCQDQFFGTLVNVNDFKVAISYGKESSASFSMKETGDLIIFGADAWRELTGDEWNAYKLFLWQLCYLINEKHNKWSTQELEDSVFQFLESFYNNDKDKQRHALGNPIYIELEKSLAVT